MRNNFMWFCRSPPESNSYGGLVCAGSTCQLSSFSSKDSSNNALIEAFPICVFNKSKYRHKLTRLYILLYFD